MTTEPESWPHEDPTRPVLVKRVVIERYDKIGDIASVTSDRRSDVKELGQAGVYTIGRDIGEVHFIVSDPPQKPYLSQAHVSIEMGDLVQVEGKLYGHPKIADGTHILIFRPSHFTLTDGSKIPANDIIGKSAIKIRPLPAVGKEFSHG